MKNSIRKYYLLSLSNFVLFHIPILTIYFNSVLESVKLVSTLFLVKSITVFIFEVPSGYISDRYSRKLSFLMGIFFNIVSLICFIYRPNFYTLILGEICFGLSECLISGSDSAFYYDNFKAEGIGDEYNNFIKNTGFIQSIFLSIAFFIGAILYGFNNKLVFICSIIFQILTLIILLRIKEYPYKSNIKIDKDKSQRNISNLLNKSIIYILIVYSVMLAMFISIYIQLFPIITMELTDNYYLYGAIYVLAMMTLGIGAKYGTENVKNLPRALSILLVIFIIGIMYCNKTYILFIVMVTRFIWGYAGTGINIYINNIIIDSNFRATIFSLLSVLTSIFSAIFMFLIGWVIDSNLGLEYLLIIWSVLILLLLILVKQVSFEGGDFNEISKTKV